MPSTDTATTPPAERQTLGVRAALLILEEALADGTAHVRSQVEDLGDLDGLLDLVNDAQQGRGAWSTSERALFELVGAFVALGSFVDVREVGARLSDEHRRLAARAFAIAFAGEDPGDLARAAVLWTDENTPIGVTGPLRRLARAFRK